MASICLLSLSSVSASAISRQLRSSRHGCVAISLCNFSTAPRAASICRHRSSCSLRSALMTGSVTILSPHALAFWLRLPDPGNGSSKRRHGTRHKPAGRRTLKYPHSHPHPPGESHQPQQTPGRRKEPHPGCGQAGRRDAAPRPAPMPKARLTKGASRAAASCAGWASVTGPSQSQPGALGILPVHHEAHRSPSGAKHSGHGPGLGRFCRSSADSVAMVRSAVMVISTVTIQAYAGAAIRARAAIRNGLARTAGRRRLNVFATVPPPETVHAVHQCPLGHSQPQPIISRTRRMTAPHCPHFRSAIATFLTRWLPLL